MLYGIKWLREIAHWLSDIAPMALAIVVGSIVQTPYLDHPKGTRMPQDWLKTMVLHKKSASWWPTLLDQLARWGDITDMEGLFQAVEPAETSEWWKCGESKHFLERKTVDVAVHYYRSSMVFVQIMLLGDKGTCAWSVNDLPKVVAWKHKAGSWTHDIQSHKSNAIPLHLQAT